MENGFLALTGIGLGGGFMAGGFSPSFGQDAGLPAVNAVGAVTAKVISMWEWTVEPLSPHEWTSLVSTHNWTAEFVS